MRLAAPSHAVSREVSFEYLNRQLVWHAFTEFLLFILPHLRIGRWRRWWARIIRKVRSPENGTSGTEAAGELAFLPERTCAICYKETEGESAGAAMSGGRATDVTNPYEAVECGHVYCYVCLAGKIELEEGEGWSCLRCACIVKRCRPWRGGVEGLTGIGDWGEEVYEKSINEQSDGDEDGIHIHQTDLLDELQDGDIESEFGGHHSDDEEEDDDDNSIYHTLNHTNINTTPTYTRRFGDIHSEAGSEETEKPEYQNHLNNNDTDDEDGTATGKNNNLWPIEYADGGSVFDDSQYNTAEDYD
jgi:peroxin-2